MWFFAVILSLSLAYFPDLLLHTPYGFSLSPLAILLLALLILHCFSESNIRRPSATFPVVTSLFWIFWAILLGSLYSSLPFISFP